MKMECGRFGVYYVCGGVNPAVGFNSLFCSVSLGNVRKSV